jgi:hypothetical protein
MRSTSCAVSARGLRRRLKSGQPRATCSNLSTRDFFNRRVNVGDVRTRRARSRGELERRPEPVDRGFEIPMVAWRMYSAVVSKPSPSVLEIRRINAGVRLGRASGFELFVGAVAQAFEAAASGLVVHSALTGIGRGAGGAAARRVWSDGIGQRSAESLAGGVTVAQLRAMLGGHDRDRAVHQPPGQPT